MGLGKPRLQSQRLGVVPDRLHCTTLPGQSQAQIILQRRIARIQPQGLFIVSNSLGQPVLLRQGVGQPAVGAGILRPEPDRCFEMPDRFVESPLVAQRNA